jgi:hypothetical protein
MTGARTKAPASCEDLCPARVVRALERSFGQIPPAARELGVSIPDLRRLTWAQPKLLEEALEELELAVIQAQSVVIQALDSPDWRRRAWASDRIMSSYLARGHPLSPAPRGATRASLSSPQQVAFRWGSADSGAAADELERDGRTIAVPRYGGVDVRPASVPSPAAPTLLPLESPKPSRRESEDYLQLGPRRRMSRGGYR